MRKVELREPVRKLNMLQINALASQKAAGQDRADGDPDVSDKEIGLSVEHGIEAAVAGQPCEQALDHQRMPLGMNRPSAVPPGEMEASMSCARAASANG